MVKAAEVKKWLKPLAERNPDLEIVGRTVIVKPVRHLLSAVLVDRTSTADCVNPRWFVYHLFSPRRDYHLSWGDLLGGSHGYLWTTEHAGMEHELVETINSVALPLLRTIQTLDDFVSLIMARWQGHHLMNDDWTRIAVELALGNIEQATALCSDRICNYPEPGSKEADVWRNEVLGTQQICRLLRAGDIPGAVRKLHEFERRTVEALKLGHLWEPTPFPVEAKLGLDLS